MQTSASPSVAASAGLYARLQLAISLTCNNHGRVTSTPQPSKRMSGYEYDDEPRSAWQTVKTHVRALSISLTQARACAHTNDETVGHSLRHLIDAACYFPIYRKHSHHRFSVYIDLPSGTRTRLVIFLPARPVGSTAQSSPASSGSPLSAGTPSSGSSGGRPTLSVSTTESSIATERKKGFILHLAGGGWTLCAPENEARLCRTLADSLDTLVITHDYPKGPSNPFPAALDEISELVQWLTTDPARDPIDTEANHGPFPTFLDFLTSHDFTKMVETEQPLPDSPYIDADPAAGTNSASAKVPQRHRHSRRRGRLWRAFIPQIDPTKLAITGCSSGGNLAAATLINLGCPPRVVACGLMYPLVDVARPYPDKLACMPSDAARARVLPRWLTRLFLDSYVPKPRSETARDPRVSPALATREQLARFPRTVIITAEHDYLCSEGIRFAKRLKRATRHRRADYEGDGQTEADSDAASTTSSTVSAETDDDADDPWVVCRTFDKVAHAFDFAPELASSSTGTAARLTSTTAEKEAPGGPVRGEAPPRNERGDGQREQEHETETHSLSSAKFRASTDALDDTIEEEEAADIAAHIEGGTEYRGEFSSAPPTPSQEVASEGGVPGSSNEQQSKDIGDEGSSHDFASSKASPLQSMTPSNGTGERHGTRDDGKDNDGGTATPGSSASSVRFAASASVSPSVERSSAGFPERPGNKRGATKEALALSKMADAANTAPVEKKEEDEGKPPSVRQKLRRRATSNASLRSSASAKSDNQRERNRKAREEAWGLLVNLLERTIA